MFHRLKRILIKVKDRTKDSYFNFTHAHLIRTMVTANEISLVTRKEEDRNLILIAFYPTGGFGDYIISSKLLDELMTFGNCRMDVYCENVIFGKAIYGDRPGVQVLPYASYEKSRFIYDLSLKVEHFIHVLECNASHIAEISPEFMDKIEMLGRSMSRIRPDIGQQWFRENIHFKRCKIKEINRWTELRHESVFQIPDQRTGIYLHEEYREYLQKLGLENKTYITINRGADSMGRSTLQTKVWPEEYYVEFLKLFKQNYPDIVVVQLGSKLNTKIKGADIYALGENFEVVKWILKKSRLHLDCEGGLVHLATQLSTKCVVIFGPTPLHFYSYPQNINLVSHKCNNCMGTHPDWAFSCFRGMKNPECMYSVTAEMVMKAVCEELKTKREKPVRMIEINKRKNKMEDIEWIDTLETILPNSYVDNKKILILNEKSMKILQYLIEKKMQVMIVDKTFGWNGKMGNTLHCEYGKKCKSIGIETRFGNVDCIPYDNEIFDYIVCKNDNLKSYDEILRVIKENGIVIIE